MPVADSGPAGGADGPARPPAPVADSGPVAGVNGPARPPGPVPDSGPAGGANGPAPTGRGGLSSAAAAPAPERRSLQLALVAVVVAVGLAVTGAGRPWATVSANVELPGLGSARLGAAEVTGNDLLPFGGLALLGLVLLVGVAVTRGHGRWAVGLALLALGGALAVGAVVGGNRVRAEAAERAELGLLEGVPGGTGLQVATPRTGPVLVVAGGLLLALAGLEALRRGPRWPALGEAFRAPPDRVQPVVDPGEPPWEGD